VAIAIFTSYTALLVAQFATPLDKPGARQILTGLGGLALGMGIWAMHFIGLLGFALPSAVTYDPWLTALSILPGFSPFMNKSLKTDYYRRDPTSCLRLLALFRDSH